MRIEIFDIGDIVQCVKQGIDVGPDCSVGNKLKVVGMHHDHGPLSLVFRCHPYKMKDGREATGAYASRFVKCETTKDKIKKLAKKFFETIKKLLS